MEQSANSSQRRPCLFIYLTEIHNVDYLSNVINLQFELTERWSNVNLPKVSDVGTGSKSILTQDTSLNYIDALYPNLVIEEQDFDNQAGNPFDQSKSRFKSSNVFRQYFYVRQKKMLFKSLKFNLQARCVISMQNYPFVESPCKISLRAGNPAKNVNYSICNLSAFINRKFSFKKVGNFHRII